MIHEAYNLQRVEDGHVAANALCRLGNQMFIAAAAATYAKRTGREFVGLTKTNVASDYPQQQMDTIMRKVKFIDKSQVEEYYHLEHGPWLCDGFPNTDIKDIFFDDFYQDARCIDKEVAYALFKPYEAILSAIHELYGDLSQTVCVNVRRGDYLQAMAVGFRIFTKEEIDSIINQFFPTDKILFVSDDIQWCKDNFKGDKYTFADKPYTYKPEIDLYIQTQCKANIISNSTFSWWGAFLNDHAEKVICKWPWFERGKIHTMDHILPDDWIKVEM